MSTHEQLQLRDQLCRLLMDYVGDADPPQPRMIEAIVASMGAAAVMMGCLEPAAREIVALEIDGKLLDHANKRAIEIRSGSFDEAIEARGQ